MEILENEIVIIFADSKLYFYKINLKESQLSFLHYLSKILNFCYLKKRKELFLLTQIESEKPTGIARSDLLVNILFINKIKPEIHYEYIAPTPLNTNENAFPTHVQSNDEYFCKFMGFNNDKYIIYICGYSSSWYDYKIGFGGHRIKFRYWNINPDNFSKLLFEEIHYNDLSCIKITDNLFKYVYQRGAF